MAGDSVNRSVGNRFASATYDEICDIFKSSLEMNQVDGWYKNQYNSCKICIPVSKIVLTKTKNPQNHKKNSH